MIVMMLYGKIVFLIIKLYFYDFKPCHFENSNLKSMSYKVNRNINNLIFHAPFLRKMIMIKFLYETFPTFVISVLVGIIKRYFQY